MTATLRRDWNVTSAAVFVRAQNFTDRESDAQRSPSDVVDMLMLGLCNETGVHAALNLHGCTSTAVCAVATNEQTHDIAIRAEIGKHEPYAKELTAF